MRPKGGFYYIDFSYTLETIKSGQKTPFIIVNRAVDFAFL